MSERGSSGWAGWVVFAGVMMIVMGIWQVFVALAALFRDSFFVATPNYLFEFDVTTWGWIHLIIGTLVALAGFSLSTGAVWARTVGVLVAAGAATTNFLFIPYQPVWSITIITACVFVIYALIVHGRDAAVEA
ncbi:MAG TPA: hypothetical protein VIE12_07865 [Actinomycetota bacterium]|jgi:hypothetical protein